MPRGGQLETERTSKAARFASHTIKSPLVLLPDCTKEELHLVLSRLTSFDVDWRGAKIPVTFSSGWKQYQPGDRPQELLAGADQALYAHKRASKGPAVPESPAGKLRD